MKSTWLAIALLAGCASSDAQVRFGAADGWVATPTTVSVFGVLHDGRLDPLAWDDYSRALSPLGRACGARYTRDWASTHADDAKSIADETRANGFTDDLLAKIARGAKGDAILVVSVSGKPPRVLGHETRERIVNPMQMTKPASTTYVHTITDGNAFDVMVSVYSIKEHRSVAELEMTYTGKDQEDAVRRFAESFGKSFPGWTCAGWND